MFLTRASLRSSGSAYYMSTSATIISIDYRNCGLTAEPPQLRGLPTATAVALEEAATAVALEKAATAVALQKSWMNSPILFKAFGLLLQHPAARFEADAVSFEASAVFEADAFFFTPLPAIFLPATCAGFLLSFFFLSTVCRTASKSSSPPPKQLMQTSAAESARSGGCTTSPQQMHCAIFSLSVCHLQVLRKDGPPNFKVMLIVITMVMLMLMLRPLATAGKCQQQQ